MQSSQSSSPQRSLSAQLSFLGLLSVAAIGFAILYLFRHQRHFAVWDISALISLGVIGTWRWLLFLVKIVRSRIYSHWVFRRWRRYADRIPVDQLPPVCLLVPTYKEQTWISERVFRAIAQEAKTLAQPITLLVNSSSDAENALIRQILESEDPELSSIRLIQMVQKEGKRKAMADGLRELAKLGLPQDTVIALMDGDSELAPGALRRCLPFFRMFPRMGALTTDELPIVEGSYLFSEWFHLRFAQRHYQMCSDALSHKVMCLTGRFSLFRGEAALHPTFAEQLENDNLTDWLWGRFKFLSGDDKSTWFWLLRHKYEMLYIPDAIVYSIETLNGSVVERAYQNMRRWYGNMLRNNNRAIALGPKVTGSYIWYNLLDQRISIWTSLITPGFLLISLFRGDWMTVMVITGWVIFSRSLMLIIVFWGRHSDLKLIHLPILLVTQWSSSLVKIWTQMNLAKQKWANRGNQSVSAEGTGKKRLAKVGTARFLLVAQTCSFGVFLLWLSGIVNPAWDLEGLWLSRSVTQQPIVQSIDALSHGIIPGDERDDAVALQKLIDQMPEQAPVLIELPIGEIDLFKPVRIDRSHVAIQGQGVGRTVLQAHFKPTAGKAILAIQSQRRQLIQQVQLSGFTLRHISPDATSIAGIVLDKVGQSTLKNLNLSQMGQHSIVLNRTQDITMEYITSNTDLPSDKVVLLNSAK
jgi:mannuronan synthase